MTVSTITKSIQLKLFSVRYIKTFNSFLELPGLGYKTSGQENTLYDLLGWRVGASSFMFYPTYYLQHVYNWFDTKAHGIPPEGKNPTDFALLILLTNNKNK